MRSMLVAMAFGGVATALTTWTVRTPPDALTCEPICAGQQGYPWPTLLIDSQGVGTLSLSGLLADFATWTFVGLAIALAARWVVTDTQLPVPGALMALGICVIAMVVLHAYRPFPPHSSPALHAVARSVSEEYRQQVPGARWLPPGSLAWSVESLRPYPSSAPTFEEGNRPRLFLACFRGYAGPLIARRLSIGALVAPADIELEVLGILPPETTPVCR